MSWSEALSVALRHLLCCLGGKKFSTADYGEVLPEELGEHECHRLATETVALQFSQVYGKL